MKRLAMLALTAALAGCASQDTLFRAAPDKTALVDAPFSASGRLSVRMDDRGQVANFEWQHSAESDQLAINTPIGTTVARLTRDGQGVRLESDGQTWQAPDVGALMQSRLGWSLPLENLAWWIRGRAAPGLPSSVDTDGSLLQQGWRIRFIADSQAGALYPARVDLSRDHLTIRLATYRWQ
jgi:outer membrane lipoprotein LolB